MAKDYPVKLIALPKDPGLKTETFKEGHGPPPIDLNLYDVYRVSGSDGSNIQKIIFGPTPESKDIDSSSSEYRKVRKESSKI